MENFCLEMLSNAECFQGTQYVEPMLSPGWGTREAVSNPASWRPRVPASAETSGWHIPSSAGHLSSPHQLKGCEQNLPSSRELSEQGLPAALGQRLLLLLPQRSRWLGCRAAQNDKGLPGPSGYPCCLGLFQSAAPAKHTPQLPSRAQELPAFTPNALCPKKEAGAY